MKNRGYVENEGTKLISKICEDAGCPSSLCRINGDLLYFNRPDSPDSGGFWYAYGKSRGWIKTCRTTDPWYGKIFDGLVRCFPEGLPDLEEYVPLEDRLKTAREEAFP